MKKVFVLLSLLVSFSISAFSQAYDTLYAFIIPNEMVGGVTYDSTSQLLIFSSAGQASSVANDNIFLRYDLNGNPVDSFPQNSFSGWGLRDLTTDGNYIYGSEDTFVNKYNRTTFAKVDSFVGKNNPNRGLAIAPDTTFWSTNFYSGTVTPIMHFDTAGNLISSCSGNTVIDNAPYGIALDSFTESGKTWLWMNTPSVSNEGIKLVRYNTSSCAIDTVVDLTSKTPGGGTTATSGISGGLEIINNHPSYPGKIIAIVVGQRFPTCYVMFVELPSVVQGIDEEKKSQIESVKIYPNPFNENATIRITNQKRITNYEFIMYDLLGKEVYHSALRPDASGQSTISRGNLPSGMYFYSVRSPKGAGKGEILGNGKLIIQD